MAPATRGPKAVISGDRLVEFKALAVRENVKEGGQNLPLFYQKLKEQGILTEAELKEDSLRKWTKRASDRGELGPELTYHKQNPKVKKLKTTAVLKRSFFCRKLKPVISKYIHGFAFTDSKKFIRKYVVGNGKVSCATPEFHLFSKLLAFTFFRLSLCMRHAHLLGKNDCFMWVIGMESCDRSPLEETCNS